LASSVGCIEGVNQVAGMGAVYTTRCSSEMDVRGGEFFARCTPQSCDSHFESATVSHVVVALDPGRKVVGYAERVCLQDLSSASALFNPVPEPPAEAPAPTPAPSE
jgi:hypothetical protein